MSGVVLGPDLTSVKPLFKNRSLPMNREAV